MEWLNEPATWSQNGSGLIVVPDAGSDFWRITDYGFIHDNGHALLKPVQGDFAATVSFSADYRAQYDQAGLMIRVDAKNWLKAGIEHGDGQCFLSAVVTRDYSDWSVTSLPSCPDRVWLRVSRTGESVDIQASLDGETFQMMRITHLPSGGGWRVGPTCCAPTQSGFTARFFDFEIHAP